jgi:multiple sugar transport system substrate-binding protein
MKLGPASRRRAILTVAPAAALALVLSACGSSNSGSGSGSSGGSGKGTSAADVQKALQTPTTLTFWTWVGDGVTNTVKAFEKQYPKIKVKVVNAGQSAAEYTKLQSAIQAGTGGPDVAQIEYFALPQFALSKQVVNLSDYGADSLKSKFTASAWNQVTVNGGVYGVPQDTGPLGLFYRPDVLKKYGISKPPATWAEFAADAQKIHSKDSSAYIADIDPGDAGGVDSMIWQAGGTPYQTKGTTNVTVNLKDSGTTQWANLWQGLLSKKLVDTSPGWTSDWWQAMAQGKYAMWLAGGWAPAPMESNIPQTKGKWAVAPVPQWSSGASVSAENGGSSTAVPTTSKNKLAAIGFAEWLNGSTQGAQILNQAGLFPATTALLNSSSFLNETNPILGSQKYNQVLANSSKAVATGWQYLPYQVYANSVFKDSVGNAMSSGGSLTSALSTWQNTIAAYGKKQGFTVSGG